MEYIEKNTKMEGRSPELSPEFIDFTEYSHRANNKIDNRKRAIVLGLTEDGVQVAPGASVRSYGSMHVGKNSFIGLCSYINGEIHIGEDVLIGPYCCLTSNVHRFDPETRSFRKSVKAPIRIDDGCWLAAGVTILSRVTIGKGNLICANSVVTKDTGDFEIWAGTPAVKIGHIDPDTGEYHWYHNSGNNSRIT